MLQKKIAYTDFRGNPGVDECFFNLSKSELIDWELSVDGGMTAYLQRIASAKDSKALKDAYKDIILRSYGMPSDDGRFFIKVKDGHKLAEDFVQSAAYDELYIELFKNNGEEFSKFINAIIPAGLAEEAKKAVADKKDN